MEHIIDVAKFENIKFVTDGQVVLQFNDTLQIYNITNNPNNG